MNKKTLVILVSLSLLAGVGLAGGLYLVSTPTNIAPKATSPVTPLNSQISPTPTPPSDFFANPDNDLNQDGVVNSLDLLKFRQTQK